MSPEQLTQLGIDADKWYKPLMDTFIKYNISTTQRQASFIGQCAHESGNFKTLEENLHYKAESLMKVWPSRFTDKIVADAYANNPEKIANKVYAGRMGNGNEESGEGWLYHGRGLIQLTGKENYDRCGKAIGVDLINQPQLLVEPNYACLSAGWFWNKAVLNDLADAQEYGQMTKRINGGTLGLDDRIAKITKAKEVLG